MRTPRLFAALLLVAAIAALAAMPALAADAASLAPPCTDGAMADVADDSLAGQLRAALASGNLLVALSLVFAGGLLAALSPCVYPLIPITLSILGARQAGSPVKGFLLAGSYVGGMVLLYSGLGVAFAAAGALAGSALQSPIISYGVALLCFVMAASMFGAFEIALPASLQTRLSQAGGSGFRGAFIMGLVSGIIAAPCTGPVLSVILTIIAKQGDIAKGTLLMVVYSLGMGLPFLVLGTFSQAIARMPKSGRWMEVVKGVFGLLMIGAGLYYVKVSVPAAAELLAPLGRAGFLGPLLIVVGAAIGALHLSFKYTPLPVKLRKGAGLALSVLGLAAFVGWATGGPSPSTSASSSPIAWVEVGDTPDAVARFDAALASARAQCKPAMIDFGAEWCIACKELEHKTYVDGDVRAEAGRFVSIKVDATKESEPLTAIQTRFGVVGLPTVVFLTGTGRQLDELTVTGFLDAKSYVALMQRAR